jgi:hypothetical protein
MSVRLLTSCLQCALGLTRVSMRAPCLQATIYVYQILDGKVKVDRSDFAKPTVPIAAA